MKDFDIKKVFGYFLIVFILISSIWFIKTRWLSFYAISFDTNGGTDIALQTVSNGSKIAVPTTPTNSACSEFIGWYTDPELLNEFDFDKSITRNVTLYAKWGACIKDATKQYLVDFDSNGGSNVASQLVASGAQVLEPSVPKNNSCKHFNGWYKDSSLKLKYNFTTAVTSNMTLYASWSECNKKSSTTNIKEPEKTNSKEEKQVITKFLVTFYSKNNEVLASQLVIENEKVTEPVSPTDTWCQFAGWYTDKDFKNKYDFASKVTKNLDLYSKWNMCTGYKPIETKKEYIVNFETLSDSTQIASQTVKENSVVIKPDNPQRNSCDFSGWYIDNTFHNEYDFTTPVTKNITLYAKWLCKGYNPIHRVKFDSNGGDGDYQTMVTDGATVTKPKDPTHEWCSFMGWYIDEGCTKEYDFNTPVTNNITIYAKWGMCTGYRPN